ncbi:RidA family protein [Bradyrhizobium sp. Pha-3]|uniref:RidA family protein n=1 Tax=Bradyrhizobium sp. Pha-3 TaxID=208375 RepID=UPI0035D41219
MNDKLPFSSAVSVDRLVFLSGEIGMDKSGALDQAIEAQAQATLDNIQRTLDRLDLTRADIVKCTIMLHDMAEWHRFNTVYLKFFDGLPLPARSAFESSSLALGAKVEIECVAVMPD